MRALREVTTFKATVSLWAGALLALLASVGYADASAAGQHSVEANRFGRALLIAQHDSDSGSVRSDGNPGATGRPQRTTKSTKDRQDSQRKSRIKSLRPSEQIPAGSGVSFPADI